MFMNRTSPQASPARPALFRSSRICAVAVALIAVLAFLAVPRSAHATPNPLSQTVTTLTVTDSTHHKVTQVTQPPPQLITLTAQVKTIQGASVFFGTVVFCDGAVATCLSGHSLGSEQIVVGAPPVATLNIIPTFGTHSYRAVYLGVNNTNPQATQYYTSTSAAVTLHVIGLPPGTTTTTISHTGTPGNYTLNAQVMGANNGKVKPTGNVNFLDTNNNNVLLATAPLGSTTFSFGFNGPVQMPPLPPIFIYTLSAVADVNNDGYPDLILVIPDFQNSGQYDIFVMLNGPTGWQIPVQEATIPGTANPLAMVTGDFNNDDKVDLAISTDDGLIHIFQGSGFGPFGPTTVLSPDFIVTSMAVGDFTNSGFQSIIAVTPIGYVYYQNSGNPNNFQFTQGTGNLSPNNDWDSAVAVGDINGDGNLDFVLADPVTNTITVYMGNGTGGFAQMSQSTSVGSSPSAMVIGDFNGDGHQDVATANYAGGTVSILLGDGAGNFTPASSPGTGWGPMFLTESDFNGDGYIDLAVGNVDSGTVTVLLGKGDGTFKKSTLTADPSAGVLAGDFNVDGYPDLAVIGETTTDIFLSSWTSVSTATATGVSVAGTGGTHLVDANYPGDTNYIGSTSGTTPLTPAPLATTLQLTALPNPGVYGKSVTLTATLSPASAQGHSNDGESVTFYNGNTALGTGTLSGGVATFTAGSLSVGVHNLKAVYSGDTFFAKSTGLLSFTVCKATSTTTLSAATTHPALGASDLLTATVTGHTTSPGNVVFTQDGNVLCTVPLGSNGKATCTYTAWNTSPAHIQAMYQGDANWSSSTSNTVTVTATYTYDSAVVLTFNSTQLTYPGATQTKTCITRATSATPTGTVQIYDGPTVIQTISVGGDGCAYWYINPSLDAGTHNMRAYYSGDSNNSAGYSNITPVVVTQVTTQMGVACWNQTFSYGGSYTCNVSTWSNAGSPPGNINYTLDGGAVQTAALSSGNTSFVISQPAVGNHTVSIWYPGTQDYSSTTPQSESFTVTH